MVDETTETGRGSIPWEQEDVAAELQRAFIDGANWVSLMQTHQDLRVDIYEDLCLEARRRYPDDDSQSRRGTGKIVKVEERPPMIVEDNYESEWMVDLREMADPMIPHNWESRAPTTRKAIDHIEAQEKEIARLKSLNTSLNEQNVSLAESNTSLSLRLQIARDNAGQAGDEYCKLAGERDTLRTLNTSLNEQNVSLAEDNVRLKAELADAYDDDLDDMSCSPRDFLRTVAKLLRRAEQADAERDDLRGRLYGLVKAVGEIGCAESVSTWTRLSEALAVARGEKEV